MQKPNGKNANIVVFCSDPRVIRWLGNPKVRAGLDLSESFGVIANTGSIKFFLNEGLMEKLFKQLDILVGHFAPEKIILLNHTDCGYYKSLDQDKEEIYLSDLKTVGDRISEKFPRLELEGYLLDTESGNLKPTK